MLDVSTYQDRSVLRYLPSKAENTEYSFSVTPETVCVSRTLPGLLPLFELGSDRWYVNVNGGSPISVNLISAWSPGEIRKEVKYQRRPVDKYEPYLRVYLDKYVCRAQLARTEVGGLCSGDLPQSTCTSFADGQ